MNPHDPRIVCSRSHFPHTPHVFSTIRMLHISVHPPVSIAYVVYCSVSSWMMTSKMCMLSWPNGIKVAEVWFHYTYSSFFVTPNHSSSFARPCIVVESNPVTPPRIHARFFSCIFADWTSIHRTRNDGLASNFLRYSHFHVLRNRNQVFPKRGLSC